MYHVNAKWMQFFHGVEVVVLACYCVPFCITHNYRRKNECQRWDKRDRADKSAARVRSQILLLFKTAGNFGTGAKLFRSSQTEILFGSGDLLVVFRREQ